MTDTIDRMEELAAAISAASAAVAAAAAALDRVRADSARASPATAADGSRDPPTDLIAPGDAVHSSGLSRAQLYRLCVRNPIDQPEGFAVWITPERRFMISKSRFELFLRHRPRRKRDVQRRKTGRKETL